MKKIFTLFLLLFLVTTGAKANDIIVKEGDNLAAIVNAADDGDIIYIEAGTYEITETMEIEGGISLTIIGAGADKTIIDGGWSGEGIDTGVLIFYLKTNASLTMEGVTLQRGNNFMTAGAIHNEGKLYLENCILKDNQGIDGSAIFSLAPLTLVNCALMGNQSLLGGAIFIYNTSLLMINMTITGNKTENNGGGLHLSSGTVTILNSIIVGNKVGEDYEDIYNEGTINMAYSAYGKLEGNNLAEREANQEVASAADVLKANLEPIGIAAIGGTMTGYKNAGGYHYSDNTSEWLSFEKNISTDFLEPEYHLTPANNRIMGSTLRLIIEPEQEDATIHQLTFLVDEGIRINPSAPAYDIAEGHDYTFYMYMNEGFVQKKPYVTVNSEPVTIRETQDGTGWVYRIPAVYEDKMIEIVLQDLTGNLNPEEAGVNIYSSAGALIVEAAESTSVTIYNITGQAVAQERVDSRAAFTLPKGAYIVRTDRGTTKAIVR